MGLLVDGQWHDQWYDTDSTGGKFERSEAQFRRWVEADPLAQFPAASGRYHLYVSYACPWAHRTLIFRKLKQLEEHIGVSVVHPLMLENGWEFAQQPLHDALFSSNFLYELYLKADAKYSGRVTVPVLWDRETNTIVSNESADIIRMFNSAFNSITGNMRDFCPASLRAEIDAMNDFVYHAVNNGVYRCGFATTQKAYEEAFHELFAALDKLELHLTKHRFLVGEQLTESDWRLFATLVRFDAVYVGHFKANLKRLVDYPNLWAYVRALYQVPGIAETVNMAHIKHHYYGSHGTINPTGIVPVGPELDFMKPHQRGEVL